MLTLEDLHVCTDCGEQHEASDLQPLGTRVRLGEPEPTGECPCCGGKCVPAEEQA